MDNYFKNCPPMMEDQGRHLGDFKTATRRNEYIKYINDVWRDDQYRLFLQLNGQRILDREWNYHRQNNSCFVNNCVHNFPLRVNNRQLWEEKNIYDAVYGQNADPKFKKLAQCTNYADYRLNPRD